MVGDYAATIDWGDGSAPTAGAISLSGTTYTVFGAHTYAEEGRYVMSMTIQHETTGTCIFESIATVADAALLASANAVSTTEGATVQGAVGSFNDTAVLEPASHYSVSIAWGDGGVSAGTLAANGNGGYDISGNYTYAEEGSYTITVTILDEGGSSTVVTSAATVADAPLSAIGLSISGTAGVPLTDALLAVFVDGGGAKPVGNYSVSLDWGDNTVADQGTVFGPGPLFQVTGNHTYASAGAYTIQMTILDEGGSFVTLGLTVNIVPAPAPPPGGSGGAGSAAHFQFSGSETDVLFSAAPYLDGPTAPQAPAARVTLPQGLVPHGTATAAEYAVAEFHELELGQAAIFGHFLARQQDSGHR